MMPSRGMGAIAPSKMPKAKRKARRDDTDFDQYAEGGVLDPEAGYVGSAGVPKLTDEQLATRMVQAQNEGATSRYQALKAEYDKRQQRFSKYAKGGEVWDKPRPEGLGKSKSLSPAKKAAAKSMAKAAGRPYPNLVDNMRAARGK